MNVENLALYTAIMLQDHYLIQLLTVGDYNDMYCVAKLQMAICDAVAEISIDFPVCMKKTLNTLADGSIPRSAVSKGGAFKVISVTDGGKQIPFTVDHIGIHIDNLGKYEVTYVPEVFEVSITDKIDVAPEVGFVMTMYLVARNYCMLSGRMEEAAMYDSRYNDRAEKIRLKRRARMPQRKFV